ncbi:MAG TPA: tRNA pseudouridine(13) synthase TruD, partial [Gammaproteobacteria bacterium]
MSAGDGAGDWGFAYGGAPARGRIRVAAEDFFVEERLDFVPSGDGEHAFVYLEKRDANSDWVAGRLAALAGVPRRDVGFAGRKDRHAVTRQWFSIGLAGRAEPDWTQLAGEGITLLEATRNARKLRRGALAGNRFVIRVREVDGDPGALTALLQRLAAEGMPNLFGLQRFGRDGANLEGARRLLTDPRCRVDRQRRELFLSAARSLLFNRVLDRRLADGSWNRALPGDALMLDGRHSFFVAEALDATLEQRVATLELHPSGPLCGRGGSPAQGPARAHEEAALQD